jgi:hypothetical protein
MERGKSSVTTLSQAVHLMDRALHETCNKDHECECSQCLIKFVSTDNGHSLLTPLVFELEAALWLVALEVGFKLKAVL